MNLSSGGIGKKRVGNVRKDDTMNKLIVSITEYLPCMKYYFDHFTYINIFNPHNIPMRWRLLSPFYR